MIWLGIGIGFAIACAICVFCALIVGKRADERDGPSCDAAFEEYEIRCRNRED